MLLKRIRARQWSYAVQNLLIFCTSWSQNYEEWVFYRRGSNFDWWKQITNWCRFERQQKVLNYVNFVTIMFRNHSSSFSVDSNLSRGRGCQRNCTIEEGLECIQVPALSASDTLPLIPSVNTCALIALTCENHQQIRLMIWWQCDR